MSVTVTACGELMNNATGPATEVPITSFPAGLGSIVGSGPINAMLMICGMSERDEKWD